MNNSFFPAIIVESRKSDFTCQMAYINMEKINGINFLAELFFIIERITPVHPANIVMLHAAETWAMKVDKLNRLRRNDRAMIRWICNVKAKDEVSSDSLLTKLGIQDLDVVLCTGRMRWFGHVEHSSGWISEVRKLNVVAQKRSGRPRKSWDEVIMNDRKKLDMDSADPQNRSEWRERLREDMSKSPTLGRGKRALKHIYQAGLGKWRHL